MSINPEWSPFYIFWHYATFFERKIVFQKFQVFFQKIVLRILSLRYGADFRRSRLVVFFFVFLRLEFDEIFVQFVQPNEYLGNVSKLLQMVPLLNFYFLNVTYNTGRD